jgi:hypothetical protein
MRLMARWGVAVVVSAAAFALSWWVGQERAGLDKGTAVAVAAAVLAVVLAVAGWWAARERPGGGRRDGGRGRRVRQKTRAGRDAYTAGNDQTIINARGPDE